MEAAGFVLAGGKSSRMGRDKALLEIGGEALVARGLRTLGEVCVEVAIAGGVPKLDRFGRLVPDGRPGCGPLGGIVAGLSDSGFKWNCFLAVDVPFVPASVWWDLMAKAKGSESVAVLARVAGEAQPLCGVYQRSCVEALRGELDAGQRKVTAALGMAGRVEFVDFEEVGWFRNLNTPEEFAGLGVEKRRAIRGLSASLRSK